MEKIWGFKDLSPCTFCSFSVLCPLFQAFLPGTKLEKRVQRDGKYKFFSTLPMQVPDFQSVQVGTSCKFIPVAPVRLHCAAPLPSS